jgi:hypothetical protein
MRWEADGILQKSTLDRLGQHKVELQRISVREARQIVQKRLQPFQEPVQGLDSLTDLVHKDYLFPLGERWAGEFLANAIDVRPRDVINWAAEGWRQEQRLINENGGPDWLAGWERRKPDGKAASDLGAEEIQRRIDEKVALKLHEHKRLRQLEPQTLPPDADNLAGLLDTLLQRCVNVPPAASLHAVERLARPKYGPRPPHDLVLRQQFAPTAPEVRTGLLCLVVSNRTSMTAFLRRLVQDPKSPERLVVLDDERRPLDPAAAGKEYLEQLRQRHGDQFVQFHLTFDQYAELDALQATAGMARSGDLEIELPGGRSQRVTEAEVIASHQRQRRYLAHPLLRLLLTTEETPAAASSAAEAPEANGFAGWERDVRDFIMGRLGMIMGTSSTELAILYQEYLKGKQVTLDQAECKARLEEVARSLHQEGRINATPHDDFLYLAPR